MKILTRYIITTVISTTILVVVALLGMDFFIQLVNQFNDLGKGQYGLFQAFTHVLFGLPKDLYQLFPMAGLIGCLLGLGVLASHSELIVMRAATLSVTQISVAVMLAIIFMVTVVTLLGEIIAPAASYYADKIKAEAKSGGQAIATQRGVWIREEQSFIHIDRVSKEGHLHRVTRYEFNQDNQLVKVSFANTARFENHQWVFKNVVNSHITQEQVTTSKSPREYWNIQLSPSILQLAQIEPDEMSLKKLYSIMQYKKNNAQEYTDYALPFWQRVFKPLATCVMMFLAIPFIFGPLRTVTMGLRLVTGIIVGFGFYILNQFLGPVTLVYQFPPLLAALSPILLFGLLGWILMLRVR